MSLRTLLLTLALLAAFGLAGVYALSPRVFHVSNPAKSPQPESTTTAAAPAQPEAAETEDLGFIEEAIELAASPLEFPDTQEEQAEFEAAAAEPVKQAAPPPPLPAVSPNAKAHLCFLSFNNPHEVSVARQFTAALNKYEEAPTITVTEYQGQDADPEDAVLNLVRSGTQCDGLVLSGHHDEDGEFWGDRTSGDLEIDFLDSLSCHPQHTAWFSQVKALWLQGCHTSSTGLFNRDVDADERVGNAPLSMIRRHLNPGDIEDSIDDLNDIFLENTNEDNIMIDYMRVFPSATVFTWWDKAPGEKAGSHWSFPFHIVQTSYTIDSDPRFFKSPFKRPIPEPAARRYAQILYEMMTRPMHPYKHDGPLHGDEQTFIKGWKEHGRWAIHRREYSFENASTIGYNSLKSSQSAILKQSRGFKCLYKQLDEERISPSYGGIVNYVLGSEELIPYNVYTLWAIAQQSGALKTQMSQSEALKRHLKEIYQAPGEGSSLKADYRKFHDYLQN